MRQTVRQRAPARRYCELERSSCPTVGVYLPVSRISIQRNMDACERTDRQTDRQTERRTVHACVQPSARGCAVKGEGYRLDATSVLPLTRCYTRERNTLCREQSIESNIPTHCDDARTDGSLFFRCVQRRKLRSPLEKRVEFIRLMD